MNSKNYDLGFIIWPWTVCIHSLCRLQYTITMLSWKDISIGIKKKQKPVAFVDEKRKMQYVDPNKENILILVCKTMLY